MTDERLGAAGDGTDAVRTVHLDLAGGYDVSIGPGLLGRLGDIARAALPGNRVLVVSDDVVVPLYLSRARASLESVGFSVADYVFPHGEQHKNLTTLSDLLEYCASSSLTRSDSIVALGGGVTGDLAGFAASVFMRGIRFMQVPTTLLAATDAAIGGKTGVDLVAGKNLVGTFCQPAAVVCDTDCLDTLPPERLHEGMAEVLKYGVLRDPELFEALPRSGRADRARVIERCVRHKRHYVELDEREGDARRYLNLGHTVGHAVELCSGYTVPHGYAVAMGMVCVARSCEADGTAAEGVAHRIERACEALGLPTECPYGAHELARAAASDKKRAGDLICVVRIRDVGSCCLDMMKLSDLEGFIARGLED